MSNAPNSRQIEAFPDIMEDEDTGVSGPFRVSAGPGVMAAVRFLKREPV